MTLTRTPLRHAKPYPTQDAAETAAARLSDRSDRPGTFLAQQCPVTSCEGAWHVEYEKNASERPAQKAPRDTGFSAEVKLQIRTRAGNGDPVQACCEACGIPLGEKGGQIQHIYARQIGGSLLWLYRSAANGALLCGTRYTGDHGLCEDRDAHMKEAGFWRERNGQEKPGDYPIMLHGEQGGRLVWLTPLGGYSTKPPARAGMAL